MQDKLSRAIKIAPPAANAGVASIKGIDVFPTLANIFHLCLNFSCIYLFGLRKEANRFVTEWATYLPSAY